MTSHDRTMAGHDQSAGDDSAGMDDDETDAIGDLSRAATGVFAAPRPPSRSSMSTSSTACRRRRRRRRPRAVVVALFAVASTAALAVALAGSLRPAAARLTAPAIPAALPIVDDDEAATDAAAARDAGCRDRTRPVSRRLRASSRSPRSIGPKARRPARRSKPREDEAGRQRDTRGRDRQRTALEPPPPHRRPSPTRRRAAMAAGVTAPCAATSTARRGISLDAESALLVAGLAGLLATVVAAGTADRPGRTPSRSRARASGSWSLRRRLGRPSGSPPATVATRSPRRRPAMRRTRGGRALADRLGGAVFRSLGRDGSARRRAGEPLRVVGRPSPHAPATASRS